MGQWAGKSAGWFPIALGRQVGGLRGEFPRSLRGVLPGGRLARLGTRRGEWGPFLVVLL